MFNFTLRLFFVFSVFLSFLRLEAVVPDPVKCVYYLETHFFQTDIVLEAMSLYQFPQGLWYRIVFDLQKEGYGVPGLMKRKTAQMVPNPLEYPIDREKTVKVMLSVLYDLFMKVMRDYQVSEQPTGRMAFDYILSKQMPKLEHCFGEEVKNLKPDFY